MNPTRDSSSGTVIDGEVARNTTFLEPKLLVVAVKRCDAD